MISGTSIGIFLFTLTSSGNSSGNKVIGNYIGTDVNGTAPLGNSYGIYLLGGANNTIGGTTAGERNVISGNTTHGIFISGTGNQVTGNYIGTDASGTADLGNRLSGLILVNATNNTIGGITAGERNIISGNNDVGIYIADGSTGNKVIGNYIGTDVNGMPNLGNAGGGQHFLSIF